MPFVMKETRSIPELDSTATLYEHSATGARILSLANSDENKAFGIAFRTPPTASDGVAHILEHSVLCGSRRYPVKEPFVELMKGSLNTFLNAFTYPDKTVYPLASTNLRDFYNLIDVYLDAVFHPLISEDTFRQEGWHYEIDPSTKALAYKGVVYNEMKGAYSDPEDMHDDLCRRSLFPDTPYGLDSGGDPSVIPSLDYASFNRFHETYYHPSNAFIYFYGDDDPAERLAIIDRWLSPYSRLDIDSLPGLQAPFPSPLELSSTYEGSEPKAWTAVSWALPAGANPETKLALSILSHILIGSPSSPLRVALIDSGLGEDLAGFGFESDLRQQAFSIGLKGVQPSDTGKVQDLVLTTLAQLAKRGIDPDAVAASMNTVEFALREKNTGRFPRGLAIMLEALGDWLYDENPLDSLAFESSLSSIKAKLASPGYFESLIRSNLLENSHRSTISLLPDPEAGTIRADSERRALESAASSLGEKDLEAIGQTAERLRLKQEKPDSPEALATIPSLSLSDLPENAAPLPCEIDRIGEAEIIFHDLPTSGILYLDLAFPMDDLDESLIPYAGLFGRVLLEMGAGTYDYIGLNRKIGKETGGIGASTLAINPWKGSEPVSRFMLRAKTLASKKDSLLDLLGTILLSPNLDSKDRFRQIVLEEKAQAESSLVPSGHRILALRLKSRLSRADSISERIGGIEQLFFLRQLAQRIDSDWEGVLADLARLHASLISSTRTVFNITMDAASYSKISPGIRAFIATLPAGPASRRADSARPPASALPRPAAATEYLTLPTQVNFVGMALPLTLAPKGSKPMTGSSLSRGALLVAKNYLDTTYLWEKVRVQGGAYGGLSSFDPNSGLFVFLSYRDPNLERSFEAFSAAKDFLENLKISPDELTRSIIGTIGGVDAYLLPDAKGFTSLVHYLTGYTYEDRQSVRREILSASPADFKAFAQALRLAEPLSLRGAVASAKRVEELPLVLKEGSILTPIL